MMRKFLMLMEISQFSALPDELINIVEVITDTNFRAFFSSFFVFTNKEEFRGCKFREWEEDEEDYANYDYEIISLHEKILLSSSSLSLLLFKRPTIMKIKNNE